MTLKQAELLIKGKLSSDPYWTTHALVKLYGLQTEAERSAEAAILHNGKGFSGTDAEILTSFAKQWLAKKWLSPKQMTLLHKKMPKYWRQVYDMSDKSKLDALLPKPSKATFVQNPVVHQELVSQQLNLFGPEIKVDILSNYRGSL
jgi:hypothetical protein